jgi:solute:Na+ symporter, SSS family
MELALADYLIIIGFIILTLYIGLRFSKQAGQNINSFFLGGRNLPWWIAGTSMVATTFAADTPLAVTELVAQSGIAGNWLWWNMLAGGMLTTFFFAKYWRRANILTDVEFIELRYSGKAASCLRAFKAIYLGVFINAAIIGWVNVALMALLKVFFNIPDTQLLYYVAGAMFVVVLYSSLSGLLGVAFTDVIQFVIAMVGCIILAFIVVDSPQIGGITGLKEQVPDWAFSFFPQIGGTAGNIATTLTLSVGAFLAYTTIQWWASWYPGNEPGGGGYIAQRMMSAKDEKHAVYASLFFQITHYGLRPWPWIIVALCALVLYPDLAADQKRLGFVMAMKDFLPAGLRGLLLVAFFAAYMSTISTQLNWGTSYLINDFYKRYIQPQANEKQFVMASRVGTLLLMLVALFITTQIKTISGVWEFIIQSGAGLGMVLILRWYWWRINAWSEITATIIPFIVYGVIRLITWIKLEPLRIIHVDKIPAEEMTRFYQEYPYLTFPSSFFIIVGITTIGWIAITLITRPTDNRVLESFYLRIKPDGNWKPFRHLSQGEKTGSNIPTLLICWISAVVMAYSALFFIGYLIFKEWMSAGISGIAILISFTIMYFFSRKVKIFD